MENVEDSEVALSTYALWTEMRNKLRISLRRKWHMTHEEANRSRSLKGQFRM